MSERDSTLLAYLDTMERLHVAIARAERAEAALAECDASAVIREAEERGAGWAIASWYRRPFGVFHADHHAFRREEAERICAEARKATK